MPLKGITILAVDDNDAQNYAIGRTLEMAHCSVLRACSGTEALALAQRNPSLIVLDVNLPDLNGFEVCRRLRANPETSTIPVIFLSATCQDANAVQMGESVGANAFLFHPVEAKQLVSVILGQLAKASSPSAK